MASAKKAKTVKRVTANAKAKRKTTKKAVKAKRVVKPMATATSATA